MREFKDSVTEPAREIKEAVDTPKELLSFNPKKDIEDALNPFAEQEEEAEALDGEIVEPAGADAQATATPPAEPEAPAVAEPVGVAAEQPPAEASEPAPAAAEKT